MVGLSIGLWQLTQPNDLCCASSSESPSPGELSSAPACVENSAARSDAAVLPRSMTANVAQTSTATRVCFINNFQPRKRVPQRLKPGVLKAPIGTAKRGCGKSRDADLSP